LNFRPFHWISRLIKEKKSSPSNAETYEKERTSAFEFMEKRNKCYRAAASAYASGNAATAKKLADQGKAYDVEAREANQRACINIYHATNNFENLIAVDLHGLHVSEALDIVETVISLKQKERDRYGPEVKVITFITGVGKHSTGGKAKIRPALIEYLKDYGIKFKETRTGVFLVYVK